VTAWCGCVWCERRSEQPALLSDGQTLAIGPPASEYHPRLIEPIIDGAIDPDEQFFFELNGYMVRIDAGRSVMRTFMHLRSRFVVIMYRIYACHVQIGVCSAHSRNINLMRM
jgi:hypothetical protein